MKTHHTITLLSFMLAGISILLLLGGCVTGKQKMLDAGMKPLSSQEFQLLLSKPVSGTFHSSQSGRNSELKFFPSGKMAVSNAELSEEGTWRIKPNGEMCGRWQTIRNGAERCAAWFKISEKKYGSYGQDGSKGGTYEIQ